MESYTVVYLVALMVMLRVGDLAALWVFGMAAQMVVELELEKAGPWENSMVAWKAACWGIEWVDQMEKHWD
jgi:hypothetical protein